MKIAAPRNAARIFVATVLLLGLSSFAHATFIPASWSETLSRSEGIKIPPTVTYTHDLKTDGFQPLSDILLTYSLSINLFDDRDFRRELAWVDLPGIIGDRLFFDLSGDEGGGFSFAGWLELNTLGTLSVSVRSIFGDFYIQSSTLTGYGLAKVPEPGTLALLGLGLAGMGLTRRRRKV